MACHGRRFYYLSNFNFGHVESASICTIPSSKRKRLHFPPNLLLAKPCCAIFPCIITLARNSFLSRDTSSFCKISTNFLKRSLGSLPLDEMCSLPSYSTIQLSKILLCSNHPFGDNCHSLQLISDSKGFI